MKRITLIFSCIAFFCTMITVPLSASAKPYFNPPYRNDIGLNVHWALGGFNRDQLYAERLQESNTYWVREHFSTEVLNVENPEAWFERYDFVLREYKARNVRVVGMLAYGFENGDFSISDQKKWLEHVDRVVGRYGDFVDVWEVWNEPDSPDYLFHNSPEEYVSILKPTYTKIKQVDPDAKVMAAGLAGPNVDFMRAIFEQAGGYFDIAGVHYYYGEKYLQDGKSLQRLDRDASAFKELVHSFNPSMQIWVTELGLSTASPGVTDEVQREYLDNATRLLAEKGYAQKVFLYNIKNYDYNSHYENNFGLLGNELQPRPSWDWYTRIARGPYDKNRFSLLKEQQMAAQLKTELEVFFGEGLIPISAENWTTVVQSYVYGGYNAQDIAQAIRFGGKTVHPKLQKKFWQKTTDYTQYVNKDWTGGLIEYAYEKPRIKVTDEARKARELREVLGAHHDFSTLEITPDIWGDLVKAYVYGEYPVSAIARAVRSDWLTVNKEVHHNDWQKSYQYQEGMQIQL
jgi:hypothetical protein